ncbi:hypothetical protein COB72_07405 [bacterium]|nr:MAG: hypothetical protein COB72_07405 [bacterium]
MRRWIVIYSLLLALAAFDAHAGKTLREISRVKGQGASVVHGLGLVVGLNGTGDSGSELMMARPLAEALKKFGNPVSIDDLANSKSVAIVLVTCQIPREGGKTDDKFHVTISVLNSAKSLKGGNLMLSPLIAQPGSPIYAFAQGLISISDEDNPTVARIDNGAQLVRDINTTPNIARSFDLIIDSNFASWGSTSTIASEINQQYLLTSNRLNRSIAEPIDARTIRVIVPATESQHPASFFGDIMGTDISSALRKLPAKVLCDTRRGIIVITGDVQVSAAVITHKDLRITTTVPPLPGEFIPSTSEYASVDTTGESLADSSRLDDLIAAFDQLDIPTIEQIHILQMLHDTGKLHARLIVDGQE